MSTKAYIGINGSGKSYEVCSVVIYNALKQGRRVVSNIAGLNQSEYNRLLLEDGVPEDCIGKLVQISHEDPLNPEFWRTDKDKELGIDAFIQPGDLLVLDEIWRFWSGFATKDEEGNKRPERVKNFFRMHRQFTDPITGIACDIILISQLIDDFHRSVRGLIDQTYSMTKLVDVGQPDRYRIDIYSKAKIVRVPLRQMLGHYDPKYFSLYKSHSQKEEGAADAREMVTDTRGNMFNSFLFKVGLPLAVVMMIISGYGMYRFFNKGEPEEVAADPAAPAAQVVQAQPEPPRPEVTEEWKTTGYYQSGDSMSVIIQGTSGNIRVLQDPPTFKITPIGIEVELPEGGFATPWTNITQTQGGIL